MRAHGAQAILFFFTLLVFLTGVSLAGKGPTADFEAFCVDNYDGDTLTVDIPGLLPIFGYHIKVRVKGIDTPEIKGKCEQERKLARKARMLTRRLCVGRKIELRNCERGKYFRLVCDVVCQGRNLASYLLDQRVARPYRGGKRKGWCSLLLGLADDRINLRNSKEK